MPNRLTRPFALAQLICLAFVSFLCPYAAAQSHTHGYIWAGPAVGSGAGVSEPLWSLAFGGEAVFKQKFGVGAEVGGLGSSDLDNGLGLASINGYFHIPRSDSRFDPFLTGGYSVTVPYGVSFANVGGGVNWWFSRHVGLKLQVRDYVLLTGSDKGNLVTFGFGVGFR